MADHPRNILACRNRSFLCIEESYLTEFDKTSRPSSYFLVILMKVAITGTLPHWDIITIFGTG